MIHKYTTIRESITQTQVNKNNTEDTKKYNIQEKYRTENTKK